MQAAAAPVGKAALAEILGWSRPKLDRRLKGDAAFPVLQRGDQSGGWRFDPSAVKAYLSGGPVKPVAAAKASPSAVEVDQAQLRDVVARPPASVAPTVHKPRRSAYHSGEATARQRKDNAEAALKENKLRIENGELVEKTDVRQRSADIFASLANDLDGLPDLIARKIGQPDLVPQIQELVDKMRADMVQRARKLVDG
jgi:phage terminase Nu1 subunit (DNA packaging protein)